MTLDPPQSDPQSGHESQTLFDRLWEGHVVARAPGEPDLIAIDRILLHERTGGVALKSLAEKGYAPRAAGRTVAVMDHVVSFREGRGRDEARAPGAEAFITETRAMTQRAGVALIDTDDPRQGIVHVTAPELALALPGMSIICPDSHTCSLGALGALAWGVGSSEAEHALATGALRLVKPSQMRVTVTGALAEGVTAKDLALALIARDGASGAGRAAVEFAGPAVEAMDLEARLTLCNMAVEFSAFTALIAPDETIFAYLKDRPHAPKGALWDAAVQQWRSLRTGRAARFDRETTLDASAVAPMISWGVSPEHAAPLDGATPKAPDAAARDALDYMGLGAGQALQGLAIDGVFIGSCTNGRLSDLRAAAAVLRGRRVAAGVRAVCVPGSQAVRRAAEAEGLDAVFRAAGFEWGEPGCSMCFYAGGETFAPGARVVSSTNRNFKGRQGPGVRTHLASPATVAACAVAGAIADARAFVPLREAS